MEGKGGVARGSRSLFTTFIRNLLTARVANLKKKVLADTVHEH